MTPTQDLLTPSDALGMSYADVHAFVQSKLYKPRWSPDRPELTDDECVLSREELERHHSVLHNLRKKRHKKPFATQFNESLMRLKYHYVVLSERYLATKPDTLDWVASYLPTELGYRWDVFSRSKAGMTAICKNGLVVMMSGCTEMDDKRWLHLSVSREDRIPNWDEIVYVKETFLGKDTEGIVKLAPRSQWVNLMPYCMHIWHCVDGEVTPDFAHGTGTI